MPTDVQVGAAYINGIQGSFTMTGITGFNTASRDKTDGFKMEEIISQDGGIIETVIASQGFREYTMEFAPKGTTRAAAISAVTSLFATTPLALITIASSGTTIFDGVYNYVGGASIKETREGVAISNIRLKQFQTSGGGTTFSGLSVAS